MRVFFFSWIFVTFFQPVPSGNHAGIPTWLGADALLRLRERTTNNKTYFGWIEQTLQSLLLSLDI